MQHNIILNTDSYKPSHFAQYPPGTRHVSSYGEARGGVERSLVFGLQAFLKEYLVRPVSWYDVQEAAEVFEAHGVPFNRAGWNHIILKHQGRLPVRIQALKEGTVVPAGTPMFQVVNTDPEVPWLTSYLETALLRAVWYPTTVATSSFELRQLLNRYHKMTASIASQAGIDFKLHDFGARGATSQESAALGGMGHLVSFKGTDTVAALLAAKKYYKEPMAGFSIPAAEHSTITAWGQDNEEKAFENMVDQFSGEGKIFAVVSDSYDIYNAVRTLWGKNLKFKVRESGGQLVVRPDSGDPEQMVLMCLEELGKAFGTYTNGLKYRVLNDSVRVIQGDGVNPESIKKILSSMKAQGWSAENVAFGMGGALLQKVDRDTQKFAMKANAICGENGEWVDVYKDPITDKGKKSKRGRQAVILENGWFRAIREDELNGQTNLLETVYEDGRLVREQSFEEIRKLSQTFWDR